MNKKKIPEGADFDFEINVDSDSENENVESQVENGIFEDADQNQSN